MCNSPIPPEREFKTVVSNSGFAFVEHDAFCRSYATTVQNWEKGESKSGDILSLLIRIWSIISKMAVCGLHGTAFDHNKVHSRAEGWRSSPSRSRIGCFRLGAGSAALNANAIGMFAAVESRRAG